MKRPDFEGAKKLKVNFEGTDVGWIYLTMTIGENSYQTRFSEVFDPLPDFKCWLEAVCIGVEQCSFSFDTEGEDIKFDFEQRNWERKLFTVTAYYLESDEFFLSDYVDRQQLVEAFYQGFLDFSESPEFNKYNWEKISFIEHLIEILELDYKTILIGLTHLKKDQLTEWFNKANPLFNRDFPTGTERTGLAKNLKSVLENCERSSEPEIQTIFDDAKLEDIRRANNILKFGEIDELVDLKDDEEDESGQQFEVGEIIDFWSLPQDYEHWKLAEKKKFLEEYLNFNCTSFEGTKIKGFKSKIIEEFLKLR